jgi:hypothetical protein
MRKAVGARVSPKPKSEAAASATSLSVRSAEVVLDLDIDVEQDRAELVLENCGDAVATDVRVTFSRPLPGLGGSTDIARLAVFQKLGVLRPGRSLRVFWDAASAILAREGGTSFVATVSWSERSRPAQRVEYRHEPAIYRCLPTVRADS